MAELIGAQRGDRVGDVLGKHLSLEERALRVERAELLFGYAVDRSALRAPSGGEDATPAHHAVGVDTIDADAVLAELGRQEPDLVRLVCLGGPVRDVARTGEHCVLRCDVDDVAAEALVDHGSGCLSGYEEASLGHHVVLEIPVALGRLEQRLGDRQPGVVDDEVDAAEGEERR